MWGQQVITGGIAGGEDLARRTVRLGRRGRALVQATRLEPPRGRASEAVVAALRSALGPARDEAELAWVRRIESVRTGLDASVYPLRFEDFGAGPDDSADGNEPSWRETTVGDVARGTSSRPRWGRLLFDLLRELRPRTALELGTSVGISAGYLGAGLVSGGGGRLITLEGGKAVAEQARSTLRHLGLDDQVEVVEGAFEESLPGVLAAHSGDLEFVFIDGHHRRDATLTYLEQVLPHLAQVAVVAFDDIHWSLGMEQAWRQISLDPRFTMALDLDGLGVVTREPHPTAAAPRMGYVQYA